MPQKHAYFERTAARQKDGPKHRPYAASHIGAQTLLCRGPGLIIRAAFCFIVFAGEIQYLGQSLRARGNTT